MSYYDSTVASYESQISSNNTRIAQCNNQTRQCEDDIAELRIIRNKVVGVDNAVDSAVNSTSSKIFKLPSVIINPFSILKLSYFDDFMDILKGSEQKKAKRGIESAISKIDRKIKELQGQIDSIQAEIRQCNSNISNLTRQKNNYISNMEKKMADEVAAKRAAETAAKKMAEDTAKASKTAAKQKVPARVNTPPNQISVKEVTNAVKGLFSKK